MRSCSRNYCGSPGDRHRRNSWQNNYHQPGCQYPRGSRDGSDIRNRRKVEAAGSHAKLGRGEFIVVEADESDASFLYLQPVLAVVTNIDADHMETYGHDLSKLKQAFVDFVQHLPFYGMAVLCVDDPRCAKSCPPLPSPLLHTACRIPRKFAPRDVCHSAGQMHFAALVGVNGKTRKLNVVLNLPGLHNVQNALAAIAVCNELNVPDAAIVRALAAFRGVNRRFQRYGEISLAENRIHGEGSFTLIDDYGHHPAEMAATIAAARGAFPGRRLVLVFQPHRYTRTRDLFEEFVKVLSTADVLLLTEVYPAGEIPWSQPTASRLRGHCECRARWSQFSSKRWTS